jgi:hypothetical protein
MKLIIAARNMPLMIKYGENAPLSINVMNETTL